MPSGPINGNQFNYGGYQPYQPQQGYPVQGQQPAGGLSPYQSFNLIFALLKALEQLSQGWGNFGRPPFPPPWQQQPPVQALYGVALPGPGGGLNPGGGGPPVQALYGVALPGPGFGGGPPVQALYGVSLPGPGATRPPVQALYGVSLA